DHERPSTMLDSPTGGRIMRNRRPRAWRRRSLPQNPVRDSHPGARRKDHRFDAPRLAKEGYLMGNRTARWLVPCGFLFLLAFASEVAADWARFRGPNGTGVATGQDLPPECSAETTLWKVPLPGVGNSSPVVWGRQLFVQSSSDDGTERYLLCLD